MKTKLIGTQDFQLLDTEQYKPKFSLGQRVEFYHCHREQEHWIKEVFQEKGCVQGIYWDDKAKDIVYQLYVSVRLGSAYVLEQDLVHRSSAENTKCPWGVVEAKACDGIIINVTEKVNTSQILRDAVSFLQLDAIKYFKQKKRLHILLKTPLSLVRVSYDKSPEFRVYNKLVNFNEASEALAA
ncbi:TPA: hypothetical protein ACVO1H_004545 [Vibrio diabolicus]